MNWSYRIARVSGINIRVHITFVLILILGAVQWGGLDNLPGAGFGVLLMLLLFLCVTLHELGHSIVAQRFGVEVREIILLPLGGVALLQRMPDKPLHELLIAVAGPLVNVVIALVLLLLAPLGGITGLDARMLIGARDPSLETLIAWLFAANVSLVVFNLIPAFPLDGGRILRALLAMRLGNVRATALASFIGQALAVVLGFIGVFGGNFLLVLVAVFVFFGAGQENNEAQAKNVLRTLRVGDAYNKYALTLTIGDRVSRVVDYILTSYQPDFAVMQGSKPIGIVTRNDILHALSSQGEDVYITGIMKREFVRVDASASLDDVRRTLMEQGQRVAAVYAGEQYLGLVSQEDINEAFLVASFLDRRPPLQPGQPTEPREAPIV